MATRPSTAIAGGDATPSCTIHFLQECIQHRSWAEAEAEMAAAIRRWPDDESILSNWALLSNYRQRWAEMDERFAVCNL
jgi:hypothetical protein